MPVILLTNKYSPEVLKVVKKQLPDGFDFLSLDSARKEDLIQKAHLADYFLASGRVAIDKEVIEAATKLKMIQRTGVGTDTLDFETLHEQNIPVYVNPGINSKSVAEHTILLILSVLRQLPKVNESVKRGIWKKNDIGIKCHSLYGKTIGIIGSGNIGKNVINMLQPFGVKILYYDPCRLPPKEETELNIRFCKMKELLPQIDILSLHCPLTPETNGIIGEKEFSMMKNNSFIVNTGRGPLIDESALISALINGQIKGAGLDVFTNEPVTKDNPLLLMDNVILTPHVGGLTLETFSTMIGDAFENIRKYENGKLDLIADKKLV